MALNQGRYTWRHDSVLIQVEKFISQTINSNVEIYCDAGGRLWTIPPDIVAASDKPDLVIVKRKAKTMIIFELTVQYEKNVQKHQNKCHKYTYVVIDLLNIYFKVKFYAIEIGWKGLISMENSNRLYV